MEDHGYWQEQLSAFVDGELSPEEEAGLREHLEGCAGCRSALALLRGMTGALASAEEEPPAALPEGEEPECPVCGAKGDKLTPVENE